MQYTRAYLFYVINRYVLYRIVGTDVIRKPVTLEVRFFRNFRCHLIIHNYNYTRVKCSDFNWPDDVSIYGWLGRVSMLVTYT